MDDAHQGLEWEPPGFHRLTNFSANEKDEASLAVCTDEESSAFILGFRRVYEGLVVFIIPRLVSRIV